MSAKIAIIIPAYNAVKTVRRAVESVLAQTLFDIEVWVVNDGSTDGTRAVLEQLHEVDSRVNIIHQDNQGAYMARLSALRKIRTPYFSFIDADDFVMPYTYAKALDIMAANNLDMLKYDEAGKSDNSGEVNVVQGEQAVYDKVYRPWLLEGIGAATIWDRVYRNQYDFGDFIDCRITMFDDLALNLQFFRKVQSCGHLHLGLYCYSETDGSAVHSFTDRHIHDFQEIIKFRDCFIVDKECNASWVLKNVRGMIISAASAKSSIHVAAANVRKLLSLPEVRNALIVARKDKFYAFLCCATFIPPIILVLGIRYVLRLRNLCK